MIAKGDLVRRHGRQRIRTVLQYYITLSEAVGHVCTRSRVRSLKVDTYAVFASNIFRNTDIQLGGGTMKIRFNRFKNIFEWATVPRRQTCHHFA